MSEREETLEEIREHVACHVGGLKGTHHKLLADFALALGINPKRQDKETLIILIQEELDK